MSEQILTRKVGRRGLFAAGAGAVGALIVAATGSRASSSSLQAYYTPGTRQHRDQAGCACPICTSTDRGREASA